MRNVKRFPLFKRKNVLNARFEPAVFENQVFMSFFSEGLFPVLGKIPHIKIPFFRARKIT